MLHSHSRFNQSPGLANAQATLDWVSSQQAKGQLSSSLTDLVVMGASAGSLGAQLWSNSILKTLKYSKASVVADR